MQTTTHYALQKPDPNDTYNKATDNSNMDAIDTQMYNNALAAAAAQTSANSAQTTANAAQTAANAAQTTANAAIPTTEIGAANGVAPLDGSNKVPLANLPAMNYVATSEVGAANGVPSLDANGRIPASQLPLDVVTDTTPPGNVSADSTTVGNTQITIAWTDPADADWAGTVLVRKLGSYPANQSDGTVVVTSTVRNQYASAGFVDTGLTNGTQYFYQLFPYDSHGNYNTNAVNQLTATPVAYHKYGVSWQTGTDVVARLGDAVGFTRASFDTLLPWSGMRRCNLSDAGVVNAYYGDPTYKDDGTNGQVMVEIPQFWYQLNVVAGGYEFWIADGPVAGFTLHPAFYRDRTNSGTASAVTKRYYSAYEGIYDGTSKLQSKSGAVPTANQTIGTFRGYATARGYGWGITDFNLLYATQMLYLVEYASFDSQTQIGQGFTASGNSAATATGSTASLGNVSGNATGAGTTGTHSMTFRGIEDWYGNVYDWIDGYITSGTSGTTPITIKIGNVGFNDTGAGYGQSYTSAGNWTNASGYESDIWGDTRLGFTPKSFAGSSSTKLFDNGNLSSGYLPFFGGSWANAAYAGAFFLNVSDSASGVYATVGARLAF